MSNLQGHHTIKTVKWAFSALYLLNQLVDYDQTCTDTPLDMEKKWSDFGFLDLIFKVTPALWRSNFDKKESLVCIYLLNQMMDSGQTLCIVSLGY